MKSIELITHAYSVVYPQYAALLAYQLSSLELHKPECKVTATICCTLNDKAVQRVLSYFRENTDVDIQTLLLSNEEISRRSIGRNIAAKNSSGDIVWFADADYFFGITCLDTLSTMNWPDDVSIVFPGKIRINSTHILGDITINKMLGRFIVLDIDPKEFGRSTLLTAIGGLQIVKGDFAREFGYLNHREKYLVPLDIPFRTTLEDVPFRKFCESKGKMKNIKLPNLYRIRHTDSALATHAVVTQPAGNK